MEHAVSPFEIEDDSGRARVLPADAIIEGIAAVDSATALTMTPAMV